MALLGITIFFFPLQYEVTKLRVSEYVPSVSLLNATKSRMYFELLSLSVFLLPIGLLSSLRSKASRRIVWRPKGRPYLCTIGVVVLLCMLYDGGRLSAFPSSLP